MLTKWLLDFVALAQASQTTIGHHIVLRGRQVNRISRTARTTQTRVLEASGADLLLGASSRNDERGGITASLPVSDVSRTRLGRAKEEEIDDPKEGRGSGQGYRYVPDSLLGSDPGRPANTPPVGQNTEGTRISPDGTLAVPSSNRQNIPFEPFTRNYNVSPTERGGFQQELDLCNLPGTNREGQLDIVGQFSEENMSKKLDKPTVDNNSTPLSSTAPKSHETATCDCSLLKADSNLGLDDGGKYDSTGAPYQPESLDQFASDGRAIDQIFKSRRMRQSVHVRGGNMGGEKAHVQPSRTIFSDEPKPWPPKDRSTPIDATNGSQLEEPSIQSKPRNKDTDLDSLPKSPVDGISRSTNLSTNPVQMRESPVPSSRLGRIWQYAGLGASLTFGAATESLRRMTRLGEDIQGSAMLNSANVERLVARLSRMRGAALKMGQLLSFQDSKVLPPVINQVLQRVQDSADYMPAWQRNRVLTTNLGSDWRDLFCEFEEHPLAAASIGQVHAAKLKSNNQPVAIKIQYPGVADSIDSDLSNLSLLLTASRLLPEGLYLDKTIANARIELAWECDYVREADAAKRFRELLSDETHVFTVPKTYDEACGPQVLTMERMGGTAVSKIRNLSQEQRNWIGTHVLRLCLREITEFRYMQTDPNWTNFFYNSAQNKIELLDFGASREYSDEFIAPYVRLLHAASMNDRTECQSLSIQLGYLTGMESKTMLDAHNQSIMILAEPFKANAPSIYDFQNQTITDRVRALIPVMLQERLSPPPEETYSLHRKLSGAFLLLARLGSKVNTKDMFAVAVEKSRALTI